jgi:ribosome modulation factor
MNNRPGLSPAGHARADGYLAGHAGLDETACPHAPHSQAFFSWLADWSLAKSEVSERARRPREARQYAELKKYYRRKAFEAAEAGKD